MKVLAIYSTLYLSIDKEKGPRPSTIKKTNQARCHRHIKEKGTCLQIIANRNARWVDGQRRRRSALKILDPGDRGALDEDVKMQNSALFILFLKSGFV